VRRKTDEFPGAVTAALNGRLTPRPKNGWLSFAVHGTHHRRSGRDTIARFRAAKTLRPHPAFSQLTREEWTTFTLHHSELHMSFIVPD
jgi:hypothetical protein